MNDPGYILLLDGIKARIQAAQHQVARYVNSELLFTYWHIGYALNQERDQQAWGAKVVDRLAADLKMAFPKMKGLSKRNLQYMMRFAAEWPLTDAVSPPVAPLQDPDRESDAFVQQPAAPLQQPANKPVPKVQQPAAPFSHFERLPMARIPWSHHIVLLDKLDHQDQRAFYIEQIIANNWSRSILLNKIDQGLYQSKGILSNNFETALPTGQTQLVKDTFKDPYFFDFLQLSDEATERDIEDRLTTQIGQFLLELGAGFAYMGRQYKLEVGGKEYFLDLLFFHTQLNCYVNIELKIDEFKPEYAGKSQFYLTAIDTLLKADHHNPSVGIILCKEANKIVVEYTLKQTTNPLGVAEYKLVKELPDQLKQHLPSVDEITQSLMDKTKTK